MIFFCRLRARRLSATHLNSAKPHAKPKPISVYVSTIMMIPSRSIYGLSRPFFPFTPSSTEFVPTEGLLLLVLGVNHISTWELNLVVRSSDVLCDKRTLECSGLGDCFAYDFTAFTSPLGSLVSRESNVAVGFALHLFAPFTDAMELAADV